MATRSNIWIEDEDGKLKGVYVHSDGYINDGVGEILFDHYPSLSDAQKIVSLGSLSSLANNYDDIVSYHKTRGEEELTIYGASNESELLDEKKFMEEYCYFHKDGQWLVSDHGKPFVPLAYALGREHENNLLNANLGTISINGFDFHKVDDEKATKAMAKYFDSHLALVINSVFVYAEKYLEDYSYGKWDFYTFKDKEYPVMLWSDSNKDEVRLVNEINYTDLKTDVNSASVAVYLMALNHLGTKMYNNDKEDVAENMFNIAEELTDIVYHIDTSVDNDVKLDASSIGRFLD